VSTESEPFSSRLIDLGLRSYDEVLHIQQDLVAARQAHRVPDTLIVVEHPDVITLGRGAKPENVLSAGTVPIFSVERGGDVTYHGPGQIVAYPIIFLRENERDLHVYLRALEEAILQTLADFGIVGSREVGRTGVWIPKDQAPRKIASIGIAIRKWVSMHGLALNVNTDLEAFRAINPCGMPAGIMTSMSQELNQPVDFYLVKQALIRHLSQELKRSFQSMGGPVDDFLGSG
jgi:lipoate-protein ligase B